MTTVSYTHLDVYKRQLLKEKREEILELRDRFIGNKRVGEEKEQSFIHNFIKRNMLKKLCRTAPASWKT